MQFILKTFIFREKNCYHGFISSYLIQWNMNCLTEIDRQSACWYSENSYSVLGTLWKAEEFTGSHWRCWLLVSVERNPATISKMSYLITAWNIGFWITAPICCEVSMEIPCTREAYNTLRMDWITLLKIIWISVS